jgi:hypothetical protein
VVARQPGMRTWPSQRRKTPMHICSTLAVNKRRHSMEGRIKREAPDQEAAETMSPSKKAKKDEDTKPQISRLAHARFVTHFRSTNVIHAYISDPVLVKSIICCRTVGHSWNPTKSAQALQNPTLGGQPHQSYCRKVIRLLLQEMAPGGACSRQFH